jgi:large subunit ribosomal protein L18
MKKAMLKKQKHSKLRAKRARARLHGTASCPRLSVNRSLRHIYVQLINDDAGVTLASASNKDVEAKGKPVEIAKAVGLLIAKKAKDQKIDSVVFDRGAFRYHGLVAAVAEGAREGGLKF